MMVLRQKMWVTSASGDRACKMMRNEDAEGFTDMMRVPRNKVKTPGLPGKSRQNLS